MIKTRLLFKKTGRAKYISHLDLMHTMQRVFLRANVGIRHTEGFNPHPYMSFILPLSVGCESVCELMDFDLTGNIPMEKVPELLTAAAPEGIEAVSVYPRVTKGAELKWLRVSGVLEYDSPIPRDASERLEALFRRPELIVTKRAKKGEQQLDLIQCVRELSFTESSDALIMDAVISAQSPSVNPESLVSAVAAYEPELRPNFAEFCRREVYTSDMSVFR